MNAEVIIDQMKQRRRINTVKTHPHIKQQMAAIRRELVKLSFQKNVNVLHQQELLAELEELKLRIKQISQTNQ